MLAKKDTHCRSFRWESPPLSPPSYPQVQEAYASAVAAATMLRSPELHANLVRECAPHGDSKRRCRDEKPSTGLLLLSGASGAWHFFLFLPMGSFFGECQIPPVHRRQGTLLVAAGAEASYDGSLKTTARYRHSYCSMVWLLFMLDFIFMPLGTDGDVAKHKWQ